MQQNWEVSCDYDSHLPLLKKCLDITSGGIVELGSGLYSTELLRQYAAENQRDFHSFDNKKDWAERTKSVFIKDWDKTDDWVIPCGLVFVDESPGEHRKNSIEKYRYIAQIIVVHDTQPSAEYVYGLSNVLSGFVFRYDFKPIGKPHATAVSNIINLSNFN